MNHDEIFIFYKIILPDSEERNRLDKNDFYQCGKIYELTDLEKAVAEIIFWARNKNIGLEVARQQNFFPGPHGHKTKRGWLPNPDEGCDADVKFHIGARDKRAYWSWWKHCKSFRHIEFLVKNRFGSVLKQLGRGDKNSFEIKVLLDKIIKGYKLNLYDINFIDWVKKEYPKLMDNSWLISNFCEDIASGQSRRPYAERPVPQSRYTILKRSTVV